MFSLFKFDLKHRLSVHIRTAWTCHHNLLYIPALDKNKEKKYQNNSMRKNFCGGSHSFMSWC